DGRRSRLQPGPELSARQHHPAHRGHPQLDDQLRALRDGARPVAGSGGRGSAAAGRRGGRPRLRPRRLGRGGEDFGARQRPSRRRADSRGRGAREPVDGLGAAHRGRPHPRAPPQGGLRGLPRQLPGREPGDRPRASAGSPRLRSLRPGGGHRLHPPPHHGHPGEHRPHRGGPRPVDHGLWSHLGFDPLAGGSLMSQTLNGNPWPALPYAGWRETYETLHRWSQIVGKTRLALESMALTSRSVADFYKEYREILASLGVGAKIWPVPVELPDALPFLDDQIHATYDPVMAERFWRVLIQVDRVFKIFRGRYVGKVSPVHLFWGAMDLAVSRFSGRTAPPHPGGMPNVGDWVMREGYSHEVSSAGFWPGAEALPEPVIYSYVYPTPEGFGDAPVRPAAAYYHQQMGEFVLPYEAVRTAPDPEAAILDFLQSTYEAAANTAGWDRKALERAETE